MAETHHTATAEDAGDDDATAAAERRLARVVAIGLPVATFLAFDVVAVLYGLAPGILVLVGGSLLGVIAILWASLRVLSGDAPLAPELEALDAGAHAVDQLAVRKRMLLRALKDLENERSLGKLDEEDFEALASTYRAELKDVLRRMDETLAPFRKDAEALAERYLAERGQGASRSAPAEEKASTMEPAAADRAACPACGASNEPDARFCKKCGKPVDAAEDAAEATEETEEKDDA